MTAADIIARALTPADAAAALAKMIRQAEIHGQAKAGGVFATNGAEAARVLLGDPAALLRMAVAHDGARAEQSRECNPWDRESDPAWASRRVECFNAALCTLAGEGQR